MLAGKCPKCGYECVGWGLKFPRHQSCARCGSGLLITEDGKPVGTGYSPFSAPAVVKAQEKPIIPSRDP
jgi:hypothetical protein